MKNFEQLNSAVLKWADKRKLTYHANRYAQFTKFSEESGELARAIIKTIQMIKQMPLAMC